MSWLPDDIREASGGEMIDNVAHDVIKLAHRALDRFPDVKKRHMFIAGGAALSSALVVGAGVAIVRRLRSGQTPDEAVEGVTAEELNGVRLLDRERHARRGTLRDAHTASADETPPADDPAADDSEGAEAASG